MLSFRNFRQSPSDRSDLEARLRAAKAEPREQFVETLTRQIRGEARARAARPWSRLAFAGAVTTLVLGTFASAGGFGYAASGVTHRYYAVKQLIVKHHVVVHSSADDQYPGKPKTPSTPAGNVVGTQAQGAVAAASAKGTLPFTGLSLVLTLVVSLALIAAGLVLRRRDRESST